VQVEVRAPRFSGVELCGVVVVEDAARQRLRKGHVQIQALEDIANRPIVDHVIDSLELAGVQEIIVASSVALSGEMRESLDPRRKRGRCPIRYLEQEAPLELRGALRLAAPVVGDRPCIVHLATGLLDEPLAPLADRHWGGPDVILLAHQALSPDHHLSVETRKMLHLAEFTADHALGMAGVWLLGPHALSILAASLSPLGGDVDLTLLVDEVDRAGGAFHFKIAENWCQYRGDPLDLLELNRIALDRLETGLCRPSNNGVRIEGRVWIDETATVRASMIVGPTVIGPGAQITDAYIGPYTSIGERARVDGAEIERSIIAAGASVVHVGGRLVASVVGRDARVFRDFSLPRALRLRVGAETEVALC
jgi:glucose-1-phosphate thymidylyltransferase